MATITQRGGKYRVQIRLRGTSRSATFERHADAKAWASRIESHVCRNHSVMLSIFSRLNGCVLKLRLVRTNKSRLFNIKRLYFIKDKQMVRRTSITERLKKSQKSATRKEYAHEWVDQWEDDYLTLLAKIKRAIHNGTDDDLADPFADLRALQEPKFRALHNVIDELITPTRELIDK